MNYQKQFEKNIKYLIRMCDFPHCYCDTNQNVCVKESENRFDVYVDSTDEFHFLKYENLDYESVLKETPLKLHLPLGLNVFKVFNTILRESRYCGFDNAMYIEVSSKNEWIAFLHICDIEEIISKGKIVFLLEEMKILEIEQENLKSEETDLNFSELDDLIFLYQPQSCGYEFFRDIIRLNDFVVYADGWQLHRKLEDIEKKIGNIGFFKKLFLDAKFKISGEKFLNEILKLKKLLLESGLDCAGILNVFYDNYLMEKELSFSDLFKCLFACKYIAEHPNRSKRIKPIIVYFPDHYQRFMDYYLNIQKDFGRVLFFRTVRNPIIRSIRAYEYIKKNNLHFFVNYLDVLFEEIYFDEFSVKCGGSYAIRFEDLKEKPRVMIEKICRLFNIPFMDRMLQDKELFSTKALNPSLDKIFTDQDIHMLAILYKDILVNYKYVDGDIDGDCDKLLGYVFNFEKELSEILDVDEELIHMEIQGRIRRKIVKQDTIFPYWIHL